MASPADEVPIVEAVPVEGTTSNQNSGLQAHTVSSLRSSEFPTASAVVIPLAGHEEELGFEESRERPRAPSCTGRPSSQRRPMSPRREQTRHANTQRNRPESGTSYTRIAMIIGILIIVSTIVATATKASSSSERDSPAKQQETKPSPSWPTYPQPAPVYVSKFDYRGIIDGYPEGSMLDGSFTVQHASSITDCEETHCRRFEAFVFYPSETFSVVEVNCFCLREVTCDSSGGNFNTRGGQIRSKVPLPSYCPHR